MEYSKMSGEGAMDYKELGKRVRKLRKELNLTQEQLAEKLGISVSFLGHIERGTRIASIDTLEKLWFALDTDANYLFGVSDLDIVRHIPKGLSEDTRKKVAIIIRYAIKTLESMN